MAGSQQVSGALASEIIAQVQYDYNEPGFGFIVNSEWLQWLNDAAVDVAMKTLCVQATETIALIADTVDYAITTKYIKIVAVRYVDADGVERGLTPGNPVEVGNIEDRGEPDKYYEFADYIGVYPTLASVTIESVKLFLATYPTKREAANALVTPAIYDRLIKKYMLAQAAKKDKKFATYSGLMNDYNAELAGSRQDLGGEKKDEQSA